MTTGIDTRIAAGPATSETAGDTARGWYLYGITAQRATLAAALAEADAAHPADAGAMPDESEPLEMIECGELAAVVRPVRLADFSPAVLQQRLHGASELEAMVRAHNRVIDAIHARQAILPARFGVVYPRDGDIVSALRSGGEDLVPRLQRLEGCDEWALHLYADGAVVREHVAAHAPALDRLRDALAAAKPGRAWFLERQFRAELEAATRDALVALAQDAYDRLAGVAVAGLVNAAGCDADADGDLEILRAAFLVARDGMERFDAELRAIADAGEGLRCACSGPWPPYSFAIGHAEDAG